ncbi:LamG-like jellyroll fold domain-containing protein [Micromonospora sp. NPDC003197]
MFDRIRWWLSSSLVVALLAVGLGTTQAQSGAPGVIPAAAVSVNTDVRWDVPRWDPQGANTAVIFRYRADNVSTGSQCGTNVCGVQLKGGTAVRRIERPAPFGAYSYLPLDGVDDGVIGTTPITTQASSGITIQVWFRATPGANGRVRLFSNTEGGKGFALDYYDGRLRGSYTMQPASGAGVRQTIVSTSGPDLNDGQWHHAALAIARVPYTPSGSTVSRPTTRARLYLDYKQVGVDYQWLASNGDFTFANSTSVPAVGAEPDAGVLAPAFFAGEIHAVVVHNYQVDHNVLATPPLRDGGRYFGAPSYHDYLAVPERTGTNDKTWSLARRITTSERDPANESQPRFPEMRQIAARVGIPLLNDFYVPQGLAVSEDGRRMFIHYYYANPNHVPAGGTATDAALNPPDGKCAPVRCPVVVAEADLTTFRVTAIYKLQVDGVNPWHAGGIAFAHGYLYTGPYGTLYRFTPHIDDARRQPIDAGNPAYDIPPVYELRPVDGVAVHTSLSGLTYSPETNALYMVGFYGVAGDEANNTINRYDLTATGAVANPGAAPDATISVPLNEWQIQGLARLPGTADCFVLSNRQRNPDSLPPVRVPSQLVRFCAGGTTSVAARLVSVTENIALGPDGMVWVLNENGAARYQKQLYATQWHDRLTPFVDGIPRAALGL